MHVDKQRSSVCTFENHRSMYCSSSSVSSSSIAFTMSRLKRFAPPQDLAHTHAHSFFSSLASFALLLSSMPLLSFALLLSSMLLLSFVLLLSDELELLELELELLELLELELLDELLESFELDDDDDDDEDDEDFEFFSLEPEPLPWPLPLFFFSFEPSSFDPLPLPLPQPLPFEFDSVVLDVDFESDSDTVFEPSELDFELDVSEVSVVLLEVPDDVLELLVSFDELELLLDDCDVCESFEAEPELDDESVNLSPASVAPFLN
jgi:hypothetical protein